MNQLIGAFVTGLLTGGLSCIALQGGLLASVILEEEKDYLDDKKNQAQPKARPVILFLMSKLVVYTILGFLLGFAGSFISLSPQMRGYFQILLGIFMFGIALNILNVHPIFRYFSLQPPKFIRKYIRKKSKNNGDLGAVFMGALTVFLPCAITQAMMLLAISSGSGLYGAAIMFSFILGTSPVFFVLGYTATRLSEKLQQNFLKIVAVLVIFTAVFSILTGATLAGIQLPKIGQKSTESNGNESSNVAGPKADSKSDNSSDSGSAPVSNGKQEVTIGLTDDGYSPATVKVKKGVPVVVKLVTNNTFGCIRAFVVPSLNIQKILPKTGEDSFEFTPNAAGEILFTCSMGMYYGKFVVTN